MSARRSQGFRVTNDLVNPLLRRLLKHPVSAPIGKRLAVLRYRGKRTGTQHELIVQYARQGDRLWIMPGRPERKTWWRNLREPTPVTAWLAGRPLDGRATVVSGRDDPDEAERALAAYLAELPRSRRSLHIGPSTDLAAIIPSIVMVRIDLAHDSDNSYTADVRHGSVPHA